ncbi:MAG: hypothetical protein K0S07_689 [Chlamydiales bacterium]|jgi:hypothetical protein|nr:hypothetical protein [Chlamydiales bacterium]
MNNNCGQFPFYHYDTMQHMPLPVREAKEVAANIELEPFKVSIKPYKESQERGISLSSSKIELLLQHKFNIYLDIKQHIQLFSPADRSFKKLFNRLDMNLQAIGVTNTEFLIFLKNSIFHLQPQPCNCLKSLQEGKLAKIFKKACLIQRDVETRRGAEADFPVPLLRIIAEIEREENRTGRLSMVNIFYPLIEEFNLKNRGYYLLKDWLKDTLRYTRGFAEEKLSSLLEMGLLSAAIKEGASNKQALEIVCNERWMVEVPSVHAGEYKDFYIDVIDTISHQIFRATQDLADSYQSIL